MKATKVDTEEFLMPPSHAYYEDRSKKQVCINVPAPMPYWYAFLEPPYGTPYVKSDFMKSSSRIGRNLRCIGGTMIFRTISTRAKSGGGPDYGPHMTGKPARWL